MEIRIAFFSETCLTLNGVVNRKSNFAPQTEARGCERLSPPIEAGLWGFNLRGARSLNLDSDGVNGDTTDVASFSTVGVGVKSVLDCSD